MFFLFAAEGARAGEFVAVLGDVRAKLFCGLADTGDVIPWNPDPRFPRIPHGQHSPFG